ncbi:MAG TPA: hypothetical protein VM537_00760 [Anaerolineae bacterium]|jgi:hypothetical protein|nr:hypothetical protein [Anaerolineae bacterium]
MRQATKRFPTALTLLVVLTLMTLLLTSCAHEAGYRIGELAEQARVKAMEILQELFEGFLDGSGWGSGPRFEQFLSPRPSDGGQ